MAEGEPVKLVKHDGTQFLHADDIAEAYLALLSHRTSPSVHYALSREWRSWEEIAVLAGEVAGKMPEIVLEDRGYGLEDVRASIEVVSAFRSAPLVPSGERHPFVARLAA